jgi:EAL domain-containing protein (putative c-di-GMP-specific phosphodiesterase class I)/CHASE2 domain-containing sensor protein
VAILGRLVLALLLVAAAFVLDAVGALDSVDRALLNARFALTNRAPSHDVVMVEIDSSSIAEIGVWPWPRSIHAQLLDKLLALDATDVAFDIDFSTASDPGQDARFAHALSEAGGFAYLAALEQNASADGAVRVNTPLPMLAANADIVHVNVDLDRQGKVVAFPDAIGGNGAMIPALAAALGGRRLDPRATTYIDYGIDLRQVDRISAADLLAGRIDPARIAGKQVIVGASAIELRDQFVTPRFGVVPGALVQAEAVETARANRGLTMLGSGPGLIFIALAAVLAALLLRRLSMAWVGVSALVSIAATEAAAYLLQANGRLIATTAAADVAVLFLAAAWLVSELRSEHRRRQAAQRRLAYLARHDAVTGTLSRHGLVDGIGPADQPLTILLVGVQRLDLVRGSLGHDVADLALAQIAAGLDGLRIAPLALVDRDTFALAWDGPVGRDEIAHHVDRIRGLMEHEFEAAGHAVYVDPEFGSATGIGAEAVLRRAELALADGLETGRPGVFTPVMEARVIARRRVDSALRQAIEEGAIRVQFQPQVRLSDGRLIGAEALARWDDPELGAVSPAEFIPLAEESGLIVRIGELILNEACRIVAGWDWNGRIGVNLSPAQMQLTDVVAIVDAALERSGLPADRLELEVTESLLVDHSVQTVAQLAALRRRGIGLAIDDFGTGYSSLSYLADLSCDTIKIDRSFLRDFGRKPESNAVVQSVIELAHRLGRTVIAEGIEEEAQRVLLRAMSCDVGQGYLLGRPMAAHLFEEEISIRSRPARPLAG